MNTSSSTARVDRVLGAPAAEAAERRPEAARSASRDERAPRLFEDLPGIVDVVWAVLARSAPGPDPVRLVFAAPDRGAGTTVLAAATAIGLVRNARVPVCLVEANVARPALADYLGLDRVGLSDLLDGRAELDDCLQSPRACPGLYVLTAGTPRRPVSGELATERMRHLLERLGALGRYLVIDAPCLLEHLEARVLARDADGTVLVLRAGATRAAAAAQAHRVLLEAGAPLFGSVFNAFGPEGAHERTEPYRLSQRELHGADPAAAVLPAPGTNGAPASDGPGLGPGEVAVLAALDAGAPAAIAAHDGAPRAADEHDDGAHGREVDLLVRRIAKLTAQLAQTEADLRRIAAAKHVDPGFASIYRGVQGLSEEDSALHSKRELMGRIFRANLELHHALQRAP